jgi:hypothetical protein
MIGSLPTLKLPPLIAVFFATSLISVVTGSTPLITVSLSPISSSQLCFGPLR